MAINNQAPILAFKSTLKYSLPNAMNYFSMPIKHYVVSDYPIQYVGPIGLGMVITVKIHKPIGFSSSYNTA